MSNLLVHHVTSRLENVNGSEGIPGSAERIEVSEEKRASWSNLVLKNPLRPNMQTFMIFNVIEDKNEFIFL
jgi:hypothetical protein